MTSLDSLFVYKSRSVGGEGDEGGGGGGEGGGI